MAADQEKAIQNRDEYWRRVSRLTAMLMAVWFVGTFGLMFFARELSDFTLFGWPISFYMAAQGLTLLYLLIVAVYMRRMRRLDRIIKGDPIHGP